MSAAMSLMQVPLGWVTVLHSSHLPPGIEGPGQPSTAVGRPSSESPWCSLFSCLLDCNITRILPEHHNEPQHSTGATFSLITPWSDAASTGLLCVPIFWEVGSP